MLETLKVKNFKSITDLSLELGGFNVFIGENGSGKSNILESISFLCAFLNQKLSNEYLANRGIRNSDPQYFKSLFIKGSEKKSIEFNFTVDDKQSRNVSIDYSTASNSWIKERVKMKNFSVEKVEAFLTEKEELPQPDPEDLREEIIYKFFEVAKKIYKMDDQKKRQEAVESLKNVADELKKNINDIDKKTVDNLGDFLIFSPENSFLRNFNDEGQILPLGIRGEGLFKEIKRLSEKKSKKQIELITKELNILDWFESFQFPDNSFPGEKKIEIKDRFINNTINYFDQRVANEGFLFLLFYLTLFISEKTPKFFSIDNIDASFNPRLCTELIKRLAALAKTYKKQVIVTTHNPFILDGLNLQDDNQRLFVVRRNIEGHTIANRIKPKEKLDIKLSEAWMRGYIGGLPNNF